MTSAKKEKKSKKDKDSKQSGNNSLPVTNQQIIDIFQQLCNNLAIARERALADANTTVADTLKYKQRAFARAILIISELDYPIKSSNDLKDVEMIGPGIRDRIDQILQTGTITDLDDTARVEKTDERNDIIELLESIDGIGPSRADKYYKLGIRSIDDLKEAIGNGTVVKVTKQMELGLKYYGISQGRIPRQETDKIGKYLNRILKNLKLDAELTICGSYRRGAPFSNDIDVVFCVPDQDNYNDFVTFCNKLIDTGFILDVIYPDYDIKFNAYCQLPAAKGKGKGKGKKKEKKSKKIYPVRRIDIIFATAANLGSNLLYFTGPANFNKQMREIARKKGLRLNEHYLLGKDKKVIVTKTEQEIFELCHMDYLTPEERDKYK